MNDEKWTMDIDEEWKMKKQQLTMKNERWTINNEQWSMINK